MAFALGTTTGAGTISIVAGGTVVTGVGTNFQAANVGAIIVVGSQWGVIATRTSTTSITIDRPFTTAVTASAYTISANIPVITQTGTDTSLATLTGVAGVTVSTNLWTITSATLVINGSLTINRLTNRLRFLNPANLVTSAVSPPTLTIGATGSFNNSVSQSLNGYSYRSPNYSIMFDGVIPVLAATTASLIGTILGSTSRFEGNIEFANLQSNAVLTFNFEGTTTLQYGALLNSSAAGNNILFYVANGSSNLTLNNYTSVGISLRIANNALTISNYAAIAGPNAININTASAINNAQYVGLQSLGSTSSIRTAASSLKYFQLINYSDTALVPTTSLASNIGSQFLLVNQLQLTASGAIGNIPNVKFYAKDSDNGSRSTSNYGAGQAYEIATTGDLIYQTTTAGTGIAPTLNVISVIYWQPTASTTTIDYRGNNGAQDLNIYQCAYNYVLSNSLTNLWPLNNGVYGGTQVRNQGFVLLQDTSITQATMATVAAYTSLNTAQEVYDYLKYFLYTNFAGQTATYVTRSGNTINAGAYDLVIDATASVPFAISGNTLTIKSSIFTGSITTTGNVTLLNGAKFSNNVITATNIYQDTPVIVDSVIMNANLIYNINSNVNVNFLTTQVSGTVSNLGTGNVLISLLNSTIGVAGTRVTTRLITSFIINGLTDGSQVYVADNLGNQVEYIANSGTSYTLNTTGGTGTWSYKVTRYGFLAQTGNFTPAISSTTTTFTSIPDTNITDPDSFVVAGYTTLFFTDQIYDYSAYFETTNVGIKLPRLAGKLLGYVDFGSYDLVFSSTSATLEILGNIITLNIIDLFTGTIFDTGVITTATIDVGTANIVYPLLLSSSAGQNYWLDITLPTASSIYIANGSGVQQEYIASSGTSFIYGLPAGTPGDYTLSLAKYGFISQTSIFTPSVGGVVNKVVSFIPDANVVDILANVIAYTDLNSGQKIYDYSSYYGTTNAGIIIGPVMSKGFGTLTVPAGLILNPTAVVLFAVSSGVVTTKSSGLDESITILSTGNFIQGSATLSNDVIIRAANLDSEIIYNADSITFYPTLIDRNTGTNPGVTTTGGIYRYKYGSTYSGVTMIGTLYTRVLQGGIIFFFDKDIVIGNNVIDLGTQGQLSALNAKIDLVPQEVWEYENRTLNNALFE